MPLVSNNMATFLLLVNLNPDSHVKPIELCEKNKYCKMLLLLSMYIRPYTLELIEIQVIICLAVVRKSQSTTIVPTKSNILFIIVK